MAERTSGGSTTRLSLPASRRVRFPETFRSKSSAALATSPSTSTSTRREPAEVTAVCSTRNVEIARSVGADHVIDYSRQDFTRSNRRYDLIIGVNAYRPLSDYARALEPNGTYVMSGGGGRQILQATFQGLWLSMTGSKKLGNIMATAKKADLFVVKALLETGQIKPVIERMCPLSEVPDAIRRIENEHARGKTVITICAVSR